MLNSWDCPYWWLGEMFLKGNSKKKKRNDCMWLIYKYENETKRQMVEKYKGRRNWMNISIYRNGDEGERNKGSNGEEHCLWQSILNASAVQSICKEAAKVAAAKGFGKKWKWLQHIQCTFVNQQTAGVVPSTATCKRAKEAGSRQTRVKWLKCDWL